MVGRDIHGPTGLGFFAFGQKHGVEGKTRTAIYFRVGGGTVSAAGRTHSRRGIFNGKWGYGVPKEPSAHVPCGGYWTSWPTAITIGGTGPSVVRSSPGYNHEHHHWRETVPVNGCIDESASICYAWRLLVVAMSVNVGLILW